MRATDERCKALLARQQKLYLAMRRTKKHLLDGKAYVPSLTKPTPVEPLPNVTRLRRKA